MEEKIGVLTYVAKTGGVKLDGQDVWINPTDKAKGNIVDNLEELRKFKDKKVKLVMAEDGKFSSLEIIPQENMAPKQEEATEEMIDTQDPAAADKVPMKESETTEAAPTPESDDKEEKAKGPEAEMYLRDHFKKTVMHAFDFREQEWDKDYFSKLQKIEGESKKFQVAGRDLTYLSWAEAWQKLKESHPDAFYQVHENRDGMPYFVDVTGGFVKVSVTVCGITHTVHLPIMDHKNNSIKQSTMTTFDINKNIQRALAKAIAMHGLGLYIYKGEDFPDKQEGKK